MNKRKLREFIQGEWLSAVTVVEEKHAAKLHEAKANYARLIFVGIGFRVEAPLGKSIRKWYEVCRTDGTFKFHYETNKLIAGLSDIQELAGADAALDLLKNVIDWDNCAEVQDIVAVIEAETKIIDDTFSAIMKNVKGMSGPNGTEYVKEIGFTLPALEDPKHEVLIPVDAAKVKAILGGGLGE